MGAWVYVYEDVLPLSRVAVSCANIEVSTTDDLLRIVISLTSRASFVGAYVHVQYMYYMYVRSRVQHISYDKNKEININNTIWVCFEYVGKIAGLLICTCMYVCTYDNLMDSYFPGIHTYNK